MTVNSVNHTYERGDAYDCRSVGIEITIKTNLKNRKES